jgi:Cdc6-like AAA superfamily ATPase
MRIDPSKPPQTAEDWQYRIYEVLDIFSPGAPIDEFSLLAGRGRQIERMIEIVMQRGQHAILYGERGVGKSSLANTFATKLLGGARTLSFVTINCHPSDDFSQVWRKVFRRLSNNGDNLDEKYHSGVYPDDVVVELSHFSLNTIPIIILDEFNELKDKDARNLIANTIKNLSDRSARATVIIVGVADSVSDLIDEHESVSRCLRQIFMQRMFPSELKEIINNRLPRVGMDIVQEALLYIVSLSRGLPHYAHLIGQRAAKNALEHKSLMIDINHVDQSMPECIEETNQSVREQYHKATMSPRAGNIYKEVLLGAALTQVDDLGYFLPAALQPAISMLLNREAKVSLFGQHLKKLCEPDHGFILEPVGSERKYRYRFAEPLMQPFILMSALRNKMITREQVREIEATYYGPDLSSAF